MNTVTHLHFAVISIRHLCAIKTWKVFVCFLQGNRLAVKPTKLFAKLIIYVMGEAWSCDINLKKKMQPFIRTHHQ